MADGKPAKRVGLLKEIAYTNIKNEILEEKLPPGQILSERELVERLGMSNTPIKSALVRLQTEGFVTVYAKQGIMVNDLSVDRITDIYDLRVVLEKFVFARVAGKLTPEQCASIEKVLRDGEQVVEKRDIPGFTKADHAFHLLLTSFSGNREVYAILLNYQDHLHRFTRRLLNRNEERMVKFHNEHVQMYRALTAPNPEEACRLLDEHFFYAKSAFFT